MCGIAGFFSRSSSESLLESMTDSLAHRGPDGRGFVAFSNERRVWSTPTQSQTQRQVGLGNRRLKILDLSDNGAQPMGTPDGRYWLTFNGLIYNYRELGALIDTASLRSSCDTEVLLRLLAQRGVAALALLNGIFSFAFYDQKERTLLLARDPVGVKPLYYTRTPDGFFFASEIKALFPVLNARPSLRKDLLSRYLMNNWIADPDTLIENVYKLPAGHYVILKSPHHWEPKSYWDLSYEQHDQKPISQWVEELSDTLDRAVHRQMRSDVPLAFFLSGGIDSSLLAAKASKINASAPTTYTIGFEWSRACIDRLDLESSRVVACAFGLKHQEIILSPSIVSLLPKVVDVLEEPIADTAALCSFLICEAAREHFTVLISGQGGDELFGGYPVFRGALAASHLQSLPLPLLSLLDAMANQLPYRILGRRLQTVSRLKKIFFSAKSPWPEPFLRLRSPIRADEIRQVLTPDLACIQAPAFAAQLALFEKIKSWSPLEQLLYLDFKTFLPSLNLTYTDKTSMANSVDVRVPLLDLEIIKLVERVPAHLKLTTRDSKVLLKRMCRGLLPHSIIDRKKAGFGLPIGDWLQHDLRAMANDCLDETRLKNQGLLNASMVRRWLKEHWSGQADHSLRIYSLMTLQLWIERFGVSY